MERGREAGAASRRGTILQHRSGVQDITSMQFHNPDSGARVTRAWWSDLWKRLISQASTRLIRSPAPRRRLPSLPTHPHRQGGCLGLYQEFWFFPKADSICWKPAALGPGCFGGWTSPYTEPPQRDSRRLQMSAPDGYKWRTLGSEWLLVPALPQGLRRPGEPLLSTSEPPQPLSLPKQVTGHIF